jgi:hypothetical protein
MSSSTFKIFVGWVSSGNAFASKTGFDIAEIFGDNATAADALTNLKQSLTAAKELQANAAALAGMGYSQTFIEEVVKQGPKAGNEIAKALKKASPDATKEMQQLYYSLEDVNAHGLDALAKTMSTSTSFATEQLLEAYNQVGVDLKESLAQVDAELKKSLSEANTAYSEAMTQAETNRDEGLADALKAFTEAKAAAQKDLDEGLAEAQKTLLEALTEAQKDYEKAIDEINKSTAKKLLDLKDKLKEIAAAMEAISKSSAAGVLSNAPTYAPIIAQTLPTGTPPAAGNNGTTNNFNTTFVATKVDPADVHLAMVSGVKYGQAVTIASPAKSITKVGAYDK